MFCCLTLFDRPWLNRCLVPGCSNSEATSPGCPVPQSEALKTWLKIIEPSGHDPSLLTEWVCWVS